MPAPRLSTVEETLTTLIELCCLHNPSGKADRQKGPKIQARRNIRDTWDQSSVWGYGRLGFVAFTADPDRMKRSEVVKVVADPRPAYYYNVVLWHTALAGLGPLHLHGLRLVPDVGVGPGQGLRPTSTHQATRQL